MEGVLSKGVLSGNGLCLEGVMYGGGFVRGGFVRKGFCPRTAQCILLKLSVISPRMVEVMYGIVQSPAAS